MVLLNRVNKDTRIKLMLLFWRIWHHRNDIVFGKGDSIISVSVAFLENYLVSLNTSAANDSSVSSKGK